MGWEDKEKGQWTQSSDEKVNRDQLWARVPGYCYYTHVSINDLQVKMTASWPYLVIMSFVLSSKIIKDFRELQMVLIEVWGCQWQARFNLAKLKVMCPGRRILNWHSIGSNTLRCSQLKLWISWWLVWGGGRTNFSLAIWKIYYPLWRSLRPTSVIHLYNKTIRPWRQEAKQNTPL